MARLFLPVVAILALAACPGRPAREDAGPSFIDAGAADDAGFADAGLDAGADAGPDAGPDDAGVDAGPDDAGVDAGPRTHGLLARVENTTCFLDGAPPLAIPAIATAPAFPALAAPGAVALVHAPGARLAVVEAAGRVRAFAADGDGSDASVVLDLGPAVRAGGLRGAAFRPDGGALVAAYLPAGDPLRLVVARFPLVAGAADVGAEEELLTVPLADAARAGGAMQFLFDGTLVVALGDGGDASAQEDLAALGGKAVRLDVSGPALSGYAVPPDNPFVADASARPEIFATGLGAPTSCALDRVTGALWCADRYDDTRDRIDLVTSGVDLLPVLSLVRGGGCGALVGPASRDAALPDVEGAVLYGDSCSAGVSALRFNGAPPVAHGDTAALAAPLTALGDDDDGHAYAVDATGAFVALVRPPGAPPTAFPTTVSATGCFTADVGGAPRTPAASLVPYEVRTALWSDGADKRRFLSLPGDATIGFTATGAWHFPVGAILIKEFLLDDDGDVATPDIPMETRFLVKRSETLWEGYSYMWDRDRQEAFLLDGAELGSYEMLAGAVDAGGNAVHRHTFPSRTQCLVCHNGASGRALGLQTGRMNTDHDYDGFVDNQIAAMDFVGLFGDTLGGAAPDDLPRFPEPADATAPLEGRARSWLYGNCAHCHQPGGSTPVTLDFRFETSLADMHACGVSPRFAITEIPDAKILDPGHGDNSALLFRLERREKRQMPPLATLIVDPLGAAVVGPWIDSLSGCP